MNYNKEEIKKYLYNIVSPLNPHITYDNIIAYYNDAIYFTYGKDGLPDKESVTINLNELITNINGPIIFKDFENKSYICKEIEVKSDLGYELHQNVNIDVLYMYCYYKDNVTVFYYSYTLDLFKITYCTQSEFNDMFIPNYTNENFKILDDL